MNFDMSPTPSHGLQNTLVDDQQVQEEGLEIQEATQLQLSDDHDDQDRIDQGFAALVAHFAPAEASAAPRWDVSEVVEVEREGFDEIEGFDDEEMEEFVDGFIDGFVYGFVYGSGDEMEGPEHVSYLWSLVRQAQTLTSPPPRCSRW